MDEQFEESLKKQIKRSGDGLKQSNVFLSIFTDNYEKDPKCVLELGLAIILNKPIYLLAPEGTKINDNMRKLACHIEFYKENDPMAVKIAADNLAKMLGGNVNG